ncbi:MAG: molybdate ABC transporter permease subunit [Burkholderiaceae bacterium]|jgi:molybdate transport system permease protein|nr:molybdate ABC transporter permease subunit [Burkholderiaceae bacterium]
MDAAILDTIRLSVELAAATTAVLLVLGTPLAWWLARGRSRWPRTLVRALVALPLVLPPSVLGFYLLIALGPHGPVGFVTRSLGWGVLAFTFWGLLVGSVLYSLPFVVQPITQAFEAIGDRPLEVAATLRAGPFGAFWRVALPLARSGLVTGAVMGFAHTLGEFGVVLMIGGNIAGRTRVLSVQIYDHVEALEYGTAHGLAGGMLLFALAALLVVHGVQARWRRKAAA